MIIISRWMQRDLYVEEEPLVGVTWEDDEGYIHRYEVQLQKGELPLHTMGNLPIGVIEAMHDATPQRAEE
jgi:hypothetical protein